MKLNFLILSLSALVPLVIGFIWYHPKVMGNAWMSAADMNEDKVKSGNLPLILFLTYIFSLFIALALNGIVIHQNHLYSILINEPGFNQSGSEIQNFITLFMEKYGKNFRTFKHGVLHGVLAGIFLIMPVIAINALFERKSAKYTLIHAGYWIISTGLMGGIICQFA